MSDIFISYANEDLSRIRPLAQALEGCGWSVFWDRSIPAGKTWRHVIGGALNSARAIVVAWSNSSIKSTWVQEEADGGREKGILVPILIDKVQPPLGFRAIQAADLTNWETTIQSSPEFDKLIVDITAILGPPLSRVKEVKVLKRERKDLDTCERTAQAHRELEKRKSSVWSTNTKYPLPAMILVALGIAALLVFLLLGGDKKDKPLKQSGQETDKVETTAQEVKEVPIDIKGTDTSEKSLTITPEPQRHSVKKKEDHEQRQVIKQMPQPEEKKEAPTVAYVESKVKVKPANLGLPADLIKYLRMLKSKDSVEKRNGAKMVYRSPYCQHPEILKTTKTELLNGYNSNINNRHHVDAMAWLCNILGISGDKSYKITLETVSSKSHSKKIKKYAKKNYNKLE